MTEQEKQKYSLSGFFSSFLDHLGGLILVNLIVFAVFALFTGIILLASYLAGSINIFAVFLLMPLTSPLFAGMFSVGRKLTTGECKKPVREFIDGMKENYKGFLLNSVILYIIGSGLFVTFSFYHTGLDTPLKITAFIFSVIFSFFFFCIESSMMTMFVSVDIGFVPVLRNSVVLFLGGIVNHFKTLLSLMLIASIVFTIINLTGNIYVVGFILLIPTLLFLFVLCCYIVVYNNYQTVEKLVIKPYQEEHREDEKRKNEEKIANETMEQNDRDELEALAAGDPEEYVFLNGRMLKRKAIQKMLEK